MPVGYEPRSFFAVAFSHHGNTTWRLAILRALVLMPVSITLALLKHYGFLRVLEMGQQLAGEMEGDDDDFSSGASYNFNVLITPFGFLIGLVTAFRLNDSFKKWDSAGQITLQMHQSTRNIISRMCAYLPDDVPEVAEKVLEIRRLLLLGCVLIKQHVRDEKDLDHLCALGLLTESEKKSLNAVVTIADGPLGDGKKDRYPSKARPTFAFQQASLINHSLMKGKHFVRYQPGS